MVSFSAEGLVPIDSVTTSIGGSTVRIDVNDDAYNYVYNVVFVAGQCDYSSAKPNIALFDKNGNYVKFSYALNSTGTTTSNHSASSQITRLTNMTIGQNMFYTWIQIKHGYFRDLNGSVKEDAMLTAYTVSLPSSSGGSPIFDVLSLRTCGDFDGPKEIQFSASLNSINVRRAASWGIMGK